MRIATVKGTIRNGRVEASAPADWPDGMEVKIEPLSHSIRTELINGMTEDEQDDDPESIARWVSEFDAIPRLVMSTEEEADMLQWREKVKRYNIEAVRQQMESDHS